MLRDDVGEIKMSWEKLLKRFKPDYTTKVVPNRFKKPVNEISDLIENAPLYVKTAWGEVERWLQGESK